MSSKRQRSFAELTWEDLEDWAGSRVVGRGRGYKRCVNDLRITTDGDLLAWVQGSEQYATQVGFDAQGRLFSNCTCPYGVACKHAVAVALSYLDAIQSKHKVPVADPSNEILTALNGEDADLDDEEEMPVSSSSHKHSTRIKGNGSSSSVQAYLDGLDRESLVNLLKEMMEKYVEVLTDLTDRAELKGGNTAKLVKAVRQEIDSLAVEPAWSNHWSNESEIPDYSRVRDRLQSLLTAGRADDVVALGKHLLGKGIQQVEMSHDEGETGMEISECMKIIFRALGKSSLPLSKRLLWVIDARLADDYAILDGIEDPVSEKKATPADWNTVADELAKRLPPTVVSKKKSESDGFHGKYQREQIMRWLILALKKAEREDEVIPLLEREVPVTRCYPELVDTLLASGRRQEAEHWSHQGYADTISSLPGIAWNLEERLRTLAEKEDNFPLVAAFRAMEFFDRPDLSRHLALQKASTVAKVWPAVRDFTLRHLETGCRPEGVAQCQTTGGSIWPLPPTGLKLPVDKSARRHFPDTGTLIDIAIHEKRNDDVLKWHERTPKGYGYGAGQNDDKVATAVQNTYPDVALKLWKRAAETQIAQVNPGAYQVSGGFLKKAKALCERERRMIEWRQYIAELYDENKRRPRMREVLDRLEKARKPILS